MRPRTCNVDECARHLLEAQTYLEGLRDKLGETGHANRELREPLFALSREIRQAGALLEQAARFGRRWLDRMRGANSGYTSAGVPAAEQASRQISIFG